MSPHSPEILLSHILTEINYIEKFMSHVTKDTFLTDVEKQHAVIRALEIIGEAVKHLPQEIRDKNPSMRWKDIAGARDILIHSYFSVDLNLVWEITTKHVPQLKKEIQLILNQ